MAALPTVELIEGASDDVSRLLLPAVYYTNSHMLTMFPSTALPKER